jgi:hypothetical protein
MFFPAADTIAFAEGGTEAMRLDSSGSVLIGTTSQSSPPAPGKVNIVGITSFGQYAGSSQSALLYMPDTAGTSIFYQKNTGSYLSWGTGANPYSGNTEFMRIDSSGNLQFNSGYGSVATAYGCRAWVTYNGSTGAVIASGGVSSVTKLGSGDWQINFSITFPDANYAIAGFVKPSSGQTSYAFNRTVQGRHDTAPTTTQCRLSTVTTNAGQEDNENTRVIFIR